MTLNFIKKNQSWWAKSTWERCEGTFSVHTEKPLTCLACWARLCATILPIQPTWEYLMLLPTTTIDFAELRIWPNGEKDSLSDFRAFIIFAESPSSMKEVKPSPYAKEIALAATIALTISGENGRLACTDREASACPLLSQIMTPKPALPISLNWAPSKLTLISPSAGGDHRI